MRHPEVAEFVREVMERVDAKNPTELSRLMGPPWTDRDQQRKIYKWAAGETAPNYDGTIALLRLGGMLDEGADGITPVPRPRSDPATLEQLQATQMRVLAILEDLRAAIEATAGTAKANSVRLDALEAGGKKSAASGRRPVVRKRRG